MMKSLKHFPSIYFGYEMVVDFKFSMHYLRSSKINKLVTCDMYSIITTYLFYAPLIFNNSF